MIILENKHLIIEEALKEAFNREKPEHIDCKFTDFDGCQYRIFADPKSKNILTVSVSIRCVDELRKYDMDNIIKKQYGDLVVDPMDDYHVTLSMDLEKLTPEKKKQYLEEIPLIKRYMMMGPFVHAFNSYESNQKFDPIRIPYRENEEIFIVNEKDAFVVIFSLRFKDPDDIVLAQVFMQEFQDARRDKTIGNAPAVTFTQGKKPLELKNVEVTESPETGFVSLVLFKQHIAAANRIKTIDNLIIFRNYFNYHLKCAKANMHIRMRDRVEKSLKVLNRAKVEDPVTKKIMRTSTGRYFERKDKD